MQRLRDTFRRRQPTNEQGEPPPSPSKPNSSAQTSLSQTNISATTLLNTEQVFDFQFVSTSSMAQTPRDQLYSRYGTVGGCEISNSNIVEQSKEANVVSKSNIPEQLSKQAQKQFTKQQQKLEKRLHKSTAGSTISVSIASTVTVRAPNNRVLSQPTSSEPCIRASFDPLSSLHVPQASPIEGRCSVSNINLIPSNTPSSFPLTKNVNTFSNISSTTCLAFTSSRPFSKTPPPPPPLRATTTKITQPCFKPLVPPLHHLHHIQPIESQRTSLPLTAKNSAAQPPLPQSLASCPPIQVWACVSPNTSTFINTTPNLDFTDLSSDQASDISTIFGFTKPITRSATNEAIYYNTLATMHDANSFLKTINPMPSQSSDTRTNTTKPQTFDLATVPAFPSRPHQIISLSQVSSANYSLLTSTGSNSHRQRNLSNVTQCGLGTSLSSNNSSFSSAFPVSDSSSRKSSATRSGPFLEIPKWRMLIRRAAAAQSNYQSNITSANQSAQGPLYPGFAEKECVHCVLSAKLKARLASPPSSSQNSTSSLDECEFDQLGWSMEAILNSAPSNRTSSPQPSSTKSLQTSSADKKACRMNGSLSVHSLNISTTTSQADSLDEKPLSESASIGSLLAANSTIIHSPTHSIGLTPKTFPAIASKFTTDYTTSLTLIEEPTRIINTDVQEISPTANASDSIDHAWVAVTPAVSPFTAYPPQFSELAVVQTISRAAAKLIEGQNEQDKCNLCRLLECVCPPTPTESSRNASLSSVGSGILPIVTLSLPPVDSHYAPNESTNNSICCNQFDTSNCITVVSLEVPVLNNKSGRSASVDSAYLQVPQRTDIGSRELPPGRGQRSRSVDIALPVGPDGPYIVVPNAGHRPQQLVTQ